MHDFHYQDGKLFCERVPIESLVKKYGTPLYVYSQHTFTDHYAKLHTALTDLDHLICYAMKSNSNQAVLRVLANLGSGFDIVSEGELRRVVAAGGDPTKCVYAGVGKSKMKSLTRWSRGSIRSTLRVNRSWNASTRSPRNSRRPHRWPSE